MRLVKIMIGMLSIFLLTGCFGESYDFSPPTVSLSSPNAIISKEKLAEANIKWYQDNVFNKKIDNFFSLARKQEPILVKKGSQLELNIENGYDDLENIEVSIWKGQQETILGIEEDKTFYLPKVEGEYMIVVELDTSKGMAQYVGNLMITK
ncbi:hypothetical protein [Rummeliibacillus stabekisii]|uniref:Lipoprotein n=1 Tax=Rummeliibacillus stabekisii TaxID=241244 RepID=A0A143HAL6_9BACL|nr:hypothetical protein [Rummeliibacillus stabekisii]AMW98758.1 hypothetical protein ATY39_04435 [Rummeliibacillus stabekisii]